MHKLQIAPIARTALLLCIGVFVLVIVTEQTLGGQQADMHSAYASAQFQVPPPEPTLPPAYEPPNYACGSFYDVIPSDYYYRGVMFMNCRNVVGGYEGGFFRPYNYVTRGQLAKIVTLAHNYDTNYSGGQHFVDVPPTDTFYQYVETAYFHGLMDPRVGSYCPLPTPLCYFHPYANAKRSEAAKAAVVAAGYTLLNPAIGSFTDVPTSHAYYQHIETAFARHILDGYIFGLFLPDGLLTRGQLVKVDTNARFYHQAGQFA